MPANKVCGSCGVNGAPDAGVFTTFIIEQMRAGGCEEEEEWAEGGAADCNLQPVLTCIVEEGEENRYVGTDE